MHGGDERTTTLAMVALVRAVRLEMREGERPRVEKRENEIEKEREAADLI